MCVHNHYLRGNNYWSSSDSDLQT